jgi:hypothetical protein
MPTADQFRTALNDLLHKERQDGHSTVDVNAGDLHRRVGGYPGPKHSMPVCCSVMRSIAQHSGHEVLCSPPSGKGASLTIRYLLKPGGAAAVPERKRIEPKRQGRIPEKPFKPAAQSPVRQKCSSEIRMLVVGSCTDKKDVRDCPCLLTASGMEQGVWRERLKQWELSAVKLYKGPQHVEMMRGVQTLRQHLGERACEVNIISAGYGLVSEHQQLVPYEVTFAGQKPAAIMANAEKLRIPFRLQEAVAPFPLVVFLLGKEYLFSTRPPLRPRSGQRFLYFVPASSTDIVETANATVVFAGDPEISKYGGTKYSVKGKLFQLLTQGLVSNPERWNALLEDNTQETATFLMESALESRR